MINIIAHLKSYQRKDTAMLLVNTLSELSTMSLQVITAWQRLYHNLQQEVLTNQWTSA